MNLGTQNRKQLILAGSLGSIALSAVLYTFIGNSVPDTAPATPPPVLKSTTPSPAATRVSSSALDPTLHPEAMELTEQLVYSGSGRNIFALHSEPPPRVFIPVPVVGPRTPPNSIATPSYSGPPPIDLRFFGTATRENGSRQAFLLQGDNVFLASEGDVVGRRYKIGSIAATSVEVTDLTNANQQRLPLAMQ